MSDLSEYLLGQMMQTVRSIESELHEVKARLDELITWAQRLALLAALWGGAVGLNLAPDKVGELIATLLKSAK